MKFPDPSEAPARLANRILDEERWAQEKLAPFAGRVFTLSVGPLSTRFRITEVGKLEAVPDTQPSDLGLTLSPLAVPSFLANPARWNEFVREQGDADLGGALKELARTLPWFVEAALAKAIGPVAGQRVADAGRRLLAFPEYAAQRVTDGVTSYARDESSLAARSEHMGTLSDGIADVAMRVDALERRLTALLAYAASARPQPLHD
jgi:ubiquinone biosynthesis accessory factor UbiJ